MKTFIIWFVLFAALIGTISYLLSQRVGITNPATTETTGSADLKIPTSFDQAIVYTCAGGAKVASAFATGNVDMLELSLPDSNPIILTRAVAASGAKYTDTSNLVFWEKSGMVLIERNDEVIYRDCVTTLETETETVAATSTAFTFTGTSWRLNVTNSIDGTILDKPNKPDDFILKFLTDGQFSVSTDCNNAGGSYSTDNKGVVSFTEIVVTLLACDGETKEADFLNVLGQVQSFGFALTEADLELRVADGTTYLSFTRLEE